MQALSRYATAEEARAWYEAKANGGLRSQARAKRRSLNGSVSAPKVFVNCCYVDASHREASGASRLAVVRYFEAGVPPEVFTANFTALNNHHAELEAIKMAVRMWPGLPVYSDSQSAVASYGSPAEWVSRVGNPAHPHCSISAYKRAAKAARKNLRKSGEPA